MNATFPLHSISFVTTVGLAFFLSSCGSPHRTHSWPTSGGTTTGTTGPSSSGGSGGSLAPTSPSPSASTPPTASPPTPGGPVYKPAPTRTSPSASPSAPTGPVYRPPERVAVTPPSASPSTPTGPVYRPADRGNLTPPTGSPPGFVATPAPRMASPPPRSAPAATVPSINTLIATSKKQIPLKNESLSLCRKECRGQTWCRSWALVSGRVMTNKEPLCLLSNKAPPQKVSRHVQTGVR